MKYDWDTVISLRLEGRSWDEVGSALEVNPSTLRGAFARERKRFKEADETDGMKILGIDIETAPHTAFVWGLFKQNISTTQMLETGRVLCFSAQWYHSPFSEPMFFSEYHDGHRNMVQKAHDLLSEADAIVHYNGARFDTPMLNREFIKAGLGPPAPFTEIDLIRTARKRFRFASNRLDNLLKELGIGEKVSHRGFKLWVDCMKGDPDAWEEMRTYNYGDVTEMRKLYDMMLPWITTHPNHALHGGGSEPQCPNCGGTDLQKRGFARTKTQRYRRFQCQNCGTWTRERYSSVSPDERKSILTQA